MSEEINFKNSPQVTELITVVPPWILRWGITTFFLIFVGVIVMSATITYPDVITTNIKINSLNSPKSVLAHQSGKLTDLMVKDGQIVKNKQIIGFIISIGNPYNVVELDSILNKMKVDLSENIYPENYELPTDLDLGDMQGAYQNFYSEYLTFKASLSKGYYLQNINYIKKDLSNLRELKLKLQNQKNIQQEGYVNSQTEYGAYKKLYKNKVISRSEYSEQEKKFLTSKYPIQETEISILNNETTYNNKLKELLAMQHNIAEEKLKFSQVLNQCLMETSKWMFLHVLRAPVSGKITFAGIIQQNQNVRENQELFIVSPGASEFYGEVLIPQYNMGKIHSNQKVLVKLHSYPFAQYGLIRGKLTDISDVAFSDSVFVAKVHFNSVEHKNSEKKIFLKNGMKGEAEIITDQSSLLQRFFRNLKKMDTSAD